MSAEYPVRRFGSGDISDRLDAFASSVQGTSLYLSRAVSDACEELGTISKLSAGLSQSAASVQKEIEPHKPDPMEYLDPEDKAINGLSVGISLLENFLPELVLSSGKLSKAMAGVDSGNSELFSVSCDECVASIATLIESLKCLRSAVISHDMRAEPREIEEFEDVPSLIAALNAA